MIEVDTSELWLPVVGYEGYYEVSSYGRVRAVPRVVEGRWGPTKRLGGLLTPRKASGRYLKVSFGRDSVLVQRQVHREVLLAFVGKPPVGFVCDHIDGDIYNNRLENLRWISAADNVRRKRTARLSREAAIKIIAEAAGKSASTQAAEHGISERHVYQVRNGHRWKGVV